MAPTPEDEDLDAVNNEKDRSTPSSGKLRFVLGKGSTILSDWVNAHISETRILTTTTICLLTLYGIANTPLFFRYRTVEELPSSLFRQRKFITGRLIKVWVDEKRKSTKTPFQTSNSSSFLGSSDIEMEKNSNNNNDHNSYEFATFPILCHIRHCSPLESLLSKSWYDWFIKWHPSTATLGIRPDESNEELLLVEIAGVRSYSLRNNYANNSKKDTLSSLIFSPTLQSKRSELEWLEMLAEERPKLTCQLLGRRKPVVVVQETNKRRIPTSLLMDRPDDLQSYEPLVDHHTSVSPRQIAVARLYYQSHSLPYSQITQWLFPTDLALSLVAMGRACVSDHDEEKDGLFTHYRSFDMTDSVRDLRRDVAYAERLQKTEYRAAAERRGMWQDSAIRALRPDVVQEAEFQAHAPWYQKLWRWLRGG